MLRRRVTIIVSVTISYNLIEGIIALVAGAAADSAALIGLGLDSRIRCSGNADDIAPHLRKLGGQRNRALATVGESGDRPSDTITAEMQMDTRPSDDILFKIRLNVSVEGRIEAERIYSRIAELVGNDHNRRQTVMSGRKRVEDRTNVGSVWIPWLTHHHQHKGKFRGVGR